MYTAPVLRTSSVASLERNLKGVNSQFVTFLVHCHHDEIPQVATHSLLQLTPVVDRASGPFRQSIAQVTRRGGVIAAGRVPCSRFSHTPRVMSTL